MLMLGKIASEMPWRGEAMLSDPFERPHRPQPAPTPKQAAVFMHSGIALYSLLIWIVFL